MESETEIKSRSLSFHEIFPFVRLDDHILQPPNDHPRSNLVFLFNASDPNAQQPLSSPPPLERREPWVSHKFESRIFPWIVFLDKWTIKLFLNLGFDPDSTDSGGFTSLMLLAMKEKKDIADILLQYGADINKKDEKGMSALFYSALKKKWDFVRFLVERGADVNTSFKGMTPLFFALKNERWDIANLLIQHGAELNTSNSSGITTLHRLASDGAIDQIEFLLDRAVPVDPITNRGYSPLMLACVEQQTKAVETLVKRGADVNIKSDKPGSDKMNPLMIAVENQNEEIVKILIENGANINAVLQLSKAQSTPLIVACTFDSSQIVKLLLDNGADPNIQVEGSKESGKVTPLLIAIAAGRLDAVRLLIEKGARLDVTMNGPVGVTGFTPLMLACLINNVECVRLLLEKKANTRAVDSMGRNALKIALEEGNKEIIQLLTPFN